MRQWCADRYEHYPVTPDDMNSYHKQYIDGHNSVALTMVDDEEEIGYVTLRVPDDDLLEQRIGFVIVDDSKRGRGLGKTLVEMAVDYAFCKLDATKVSLGVFENNLAAIRCYESVGFRRVVRKKTESYECLGETWNCIEMEYHTVKKPLNYMTLAELWQLFPIILTPHQPQWKEWAENEIQNLSRILSTYSPIINHIGSTAINNIQAKPIIDILVEISPDVDWQSVKAELETAGYTCMSSTGNRMSFNKGYTPDGYADKVFHIHIHVIGDNDEIIFRDYLNSHSEVAREYEALKFSLLPQFQNDRDGYTDAKTDFIKGVLYDAKNG